MKCANCGDPAFRYISDSGEERVRCGKCVGASLKTRSSNSTRQITNCVCCRNYSKKLAKLKRVINEDRDPKIALLQIRRIMARESDPCQVIQSIKKLIGKE